LLDTLTEDEFDIYDVFDLINNIPSTVDELENGIFDCEYKNYIKVWILGKLLKYNVDWVCNLTYLYLSCYQLIKVPESIGNFINLTMLYLYDNQLTTLPESVGNLTNLTELNLNDNQLTDEEKTRLTKIFGNKVQF